MYPYTREGVLWRARCEQAAKAAEEAGRPAPVLPRDYSAHPPEYYRYELYGVVVHTGTATSGHYYSFIRVRRGDPRARGTIADALASAPAARARDGDDAASRGVWVSFNDSRVTPFDLKEMPSECFGGTQETAEVRPPMVASSAWNQRSNNAYMLVPACPEAPHGGARGGFREPRTALIFGANRGRRGRSGRARGARGAGGLSGHGRSPHRIGSPGRTAESPRPDGDCR